MTTNLFETLNKINVNEHIEKKGKFSYLSWPYAVAELRKHAPDATWETIKSDGKPYCQTDAGCFVEVAVTVNGITLSQIHPVLDSSNRTVKSPDAFQVNTSIQRCLVKAIALHGLGLYIYAGEDLPDTKEEKTDKSENFRDTEPVRPQFEPARYAAIELAVTSAIDAYKYGDIKSAYECIYVDLDDSVEINEAWAMLKDMPPLRRAVKEYSQQINKQKEAA
jgi:hypothetical protein